MRRWWWVPFIVVGVALAATAATVIAEREIEAANFREGAVVTSGTAYQAPASHASTKIVRVRFAVGEKWCSFDAVVPASVGEGDRVEILYPVGKPEEARVGLTLVQRSSDMLFLGSAGFLLLAMVLGGALLAGRADRRERRLEANGVRVEARVKSLERTGGRTPLGRFFWTLVATGTDEQGVPRDWKCSLLIEVDPKQAYPDGSSVTVIYLPGQPDECVVDLGRLPRDTWAHGGKP